MTVEAGEDTGLDMVDQEIPEVPFSVIKVEITPDDLTAWDADIDPRIEEFYRQNPDIDGNIVVMAGKFEPPHKGHAYGIYTGLKLAEKLKNGKFTVVVGDSEQEKPLDGSDDYKKYPFSFEDRVELLKRVVKQLGVKEKEIDEKISFIHKRDVNNNERWGREVAEAIEKVRELGKIGVVMANDTGAEDNPRSVWRIFKEQGKKLFVPNFHNRPENSGTEIRKNPVFGNGGPRQVAWNR
jgi:cytidyltransferase-like protein